MEKMEKKFAIVNDCDKPCRRLVAECIDGKFYYMARAEESLKANYDGMIPLNPTFLEDFGFEIRNLKETNSVIFLQKYKSKAKYEDGRIRQWQDIGNFTLPRVCLFDLNLTLKF